MVTRAKIRKGKNKNGKRKPKRTPKPYVRSSGPDRKMFIVPDSRQDDDGGLVVPYAPREVNHTALSTEWTEIPRSGRAPLLVPSNEPQPRMSFTLFFGSTDPDESVAGDLRKLARYARQSSRLYIEYSSWEKGLWRISSMSFNSVIRNTQHEITRANVDIEFVLASKITRHIGPISGGVSDDKDGKKGGKRKPKKYKVKRGDTLHKIAIKFYKDASKWRRIARANKINNPRSKRQLKRGRILRIP